MARKLKISTYDDLTKTLTKLLQELDNEDVTSNRRQNVKLMVDICKVQGQVLRDTELMKAMEDYQALVEKASRMNDEYLI